METLSSQQLDRRINAFLSRKHEEYPELKLRPEPKRAEGQLGLMSALAQVLAGTRWQPNR